jgi:hypothetical protein
MKYRIVMEYSREIEAKDLEQAWEFARRLMTIKDFVIGERPGNEHYLLRRVEPTEKPVTPGGSVECPHCHWGFAPSVIDQHIREKH